VSVEAGSRHTNTRTGLHVARALRAREQHRNKQIVIDWPGGSVYRNRLGLDSVIVSRARYEAAVCRRRRIPITS